MSGGTAHQRAAGAGLCGDSGTGECPASPKGGCTENPGHSRPTGEESFLNWTYLFACGSLSLVFFFQIFHGDFKVLVLFFIAMLLLDYFHHHDIIRCLKFEAWSREQDRAATGTWNQSLKSDDASLTVMAVLDIKTDGCTVHIISALSVLCYTT